MSLLAELKRRNVIRMAGLYAVGAWLITQVSSTVLPMFGAPEWLPRTVVILLALGFIPTLVFAWVFELTPEGIRRDAEVKPEESIAPQTARRMDRTIIVVLICALVYFAVDKFMLTPRRDATIAAPVQQSAATSPLPTAASGAAISAKSIAVLPFTDLSPAHDQEYFSDGMAEEILNALAQVKDLKVAGRTSSFSFKGKNEDLRAIGKALGVANILEGSVRKQGDKVRITAQLIQVSDDTHLWSQAFNGDLSDVFRLQEDIARAITDQLKAVLTDDQKKNLVQVGTSNTEAYTLYLQATAALNQRDYARMGEAIGWLEKALTLDPGFARAHARLALIHILGQGRYGASESEAERQAQLALALDPTLAETQYVLGGVARHQRHWFDARAATDRALELAPNDASAHLYSAQLLIMTGYTRQGIAHLEQALTIDPLLPNALFWRGRQYVFAGDLDAAERLFRRAADLGLSFANVGLAQVAFARGDYSTARALMLPYFLLQQGAPSCLRNPEAAFPIMLEGMMGGDAMALEKAQAVIDECLAAKPAVVPLWAAEFLLRTGQPQRALSVIEQGPTSDDAGLFMNFWGMWGKEALRLPEFAEFARKVGFADLWDRYGAPDACRRAGPRDYRCE